MDPVLKKMEEERWQYARFNVGSLQEGPKMRNLTITDLGESRFIYL